MSYTYSKYWIAIFNMYSFCSIADIVFFIFLYQRWIYKTDLTRVNEFGFSGEMEQEAAAARTSQANGAPPAIAAASPKDVSSKKND